MPNYEVGEIEGIGATYAAKLKEADIDRTEGLLEACCTPGGRKAISGKTGITEKLLLKWANMADLMRISGVGKQYAELLENAGVDTVKELKTRNTENLAAKMKEVNEVKKLAKSSPAVSLVEGWIAQAGSLPPKITH